jgi:hypothetical protein
MMEAVSTTRLDNPEDSHLHTRRRENLKSHESLLDGETVLRASRHIVRIVLIMLKHPVLLWIMSWGNCYEEVVLF